MTENIMMLEMKTGETQAERKRSRGWARGYKRETLYTEYRLYSLLEERYTKDEKEKTWEVVYYLVGVHSPGV